MPKKTPIRQALQANSSLHQDVEDGLKAVEAPHLDYFDRTIRPDFSDSIDLDSAMRKGHAQENRWDYLLGHLPSGHVIGLEPHSAKTEEVQTLKKKRENALRQLRNHLRDGVRVERWLWVASGKVQFADTEKTRRILDQAGIAFVGRKILPSHLPGTKKSNNKK